MTLPNTARSSIARTRVDAVRERADPVDRRIKPPLCDQIEAGFLVLRGPAGRTDNVHLRHEEIGDVGHRRIAAGSAAAQQPPETLHAAHRRRPCISGGEIDDDIDTAAAQQRAGGLADIFVDLRGCVIDRVVGADLTQSRAFLVAAGGGDHLASGQLRKQNAGRADAARCTKNEDRFTGLDLPARVQHAMRGAIGAGERGGLLIGNVARNAH